MAINLSSLLFTNQADIVPLQGVVDSIINFGIVNTLDGNDKITGTGTDTGTGFFSGVGIYNAGTINTGADNDTITGTGSGTGYGIYNPGTIDTGAGFDIVDARAGGFGGNGTIRLGADNDFIKGFGSGNFFGGTGTDRLELTAGTYTVGISGSVTSFTRNGITMNTSEFELLVVGLGFNSKALYGFSTLTNGRTITVVA